jgi:two-component system sensor histidine kinase NreB
VYSDQDIHIIATITHQGAIAYANVRLLEQKQALARQLVRMNEEQRKQIARDIHDIVLPEIAYARYRVEQNPSESEQILDLVAGRLRQLITDQRTLMLDQGLELAFQELTNETQKLIGEKPIILYYSRKAQPFWLNEEQSVTFYRIAQEAIRNALQHAQAEHISLLLESSGDALRLVVEDDGVGFSISKVEIFGSGKQSYGLLGMQELAEMIGGILRIESDPGEGTTVTLEIRLLQE